MINLLLMKRDEAVEELSHKLGWEKTLFLGREVVLVAETNAKKMLLEIKKAKQEQKIVLYRAGSEEMLRFALEKTTVDMVFGMETIHEKESLHYSRGGLDQILCSIAARQGKTIAFSFAELLDGSDRARLLRRMRFNVQLCRKYKVKMLFSTFASEKMGLRGAKDLEAFWMVLQKN